MTRAHATPENVTRKLLDAHLIGGELEPGAEIALRSSPPVPACSTTPPDREIPVGHELSPRQVDVLLAGGLIPWVRSRSG